MGTVPAIIINRHPKTSLTHKARSQDFQKGVNGHFPELNFKTTGNQKLLMLQASNVKLLYRVGPSEFGMTGNLALPN